MSTIPPVPLTPPPPPQPIQQQDQNQQAPVAQSPVNGQPPTPSQQQFVHSALIGHGFKSLVNSMAGSSTQYQMTPNGPVPVEVPNKPGQFFRNILAGAIMGGVAGGQGPNEAGSGWGAAARGAGAASQGFQQQQQARQQQAQQEFQNQQSANKENRETTLMNAQIANMQSETAARQHLSDLQDKEYHDKHNSASAALYDSLKEAGGVAPIDGKLPEDITAYDLAKAYTKDPTIRQAPTGYVRHFLDKTDSSEVTWNGDHWTHPDGTPADMTDKTSIQVVDVPTDAMKTKKPVTGAVLNKIAGQNLFKSDQTYQVSPLDQDALNTTRLKNDNEQARTAAELRAAKAQERNAANEAERLKRDGYNAAREQVVQENITLEDQLKNSTYGPGSPEEKKVQDTIDANNARLRQLYEQTFPGEKLPPSTVVPPPDPIGKVVNVAQGITDPTKALEMIKNAPISADQKKTATQEYNDWLAKQPKPQQVTLPGLVKQAGKNIGENFNRLETFFTGGAAPEQGAP